MRLYECIIAEVEYSDVNKRGPGAGAIQNIVAEVKVVGAKALAAHLRAIANEIDPPKSTMRGVPTVVNMHTGGQINPRGIEG